ncbi:hypothetical protein D5F01_LYC18707 [Larimichthys crocea]|uniref:Uncharacterized protein n=1 Tax=Larimichthys crocea TaxID=215358 RepID=A0A6G0HVU0_LARCR|nr:hypothetical protein D5F01_LYC18707 [Larimichthys crocea]
MDLTKCLILIMAVPLCRGTVVENYEKNISCNDIKTTAGFKFPHNGSERSEIFVTCNKTVIAHALIAEQFFKYFNEVISMDNYSVITRECRDLDIKCIVPDGKFVKEIIIYYRITEKVKNPDPTDLSTTWGLIIAGVTCGVAFIIGLSLYFYKKKMKKQPSAAPACDEPVNEQAEMQMLSEMPSTSGPLESGENDTERDNTLESVHVDSIDPMADGKTPQSLSLDHNFNHEGIQPFENDPDNNRASAHRAIHRNLRDDPGGINDKRIRKTHNGCTLGVQTPEDHENEGQPLLLNQRAAIQAFDTRGEATDLVNKHDFDQHQISGCPTAPETDVESTLNTKNHTHI